jgi:hypothetical protein
MNYISKFVKPAPEKLKDNIAVWSEMGEITAKYKSLSLG